MGSPDREYQRQLNGMGGGISSLSKICVVGRLEDFTESELQKPADEIRGTVDVVYTFVQVSITEPTVHYGGNCGNLSAMIGVYALDEQLCEPGKIFEGEDGVRKMTIRSYNTNTAKRLDTTFPIKENGAPILDLAQVSVAGVPGKASEILLDFVAPGGSKTGKLLPSGTPTNTLSFELQEGQELSIRASLIDAANPVTFVLSSDLHALVTPNPAPDAVLDFASAETRTVVERIRRTGAKKMGLDPRTAGLVAVLTPVSVTSQADIQVQAFSLGVPHKAVPMTIAACLGVASGVKDSIANELVTQKRVASGTEGKSKVTLKHPGGLVDVGAEFDGDLSVKSAQVVRTGRRLMKGAVYW